VTVRNVTDLQGWVYASSFAEMGQLLGSVRNIVVPTDQCCRSRKWVRRMKVWPRDDPPHSVTISGSLL
jgi:hypothetical protein